LSEVRKWFCDRCKQEIDGRENLGTTPWQLWSVTISVNHYGHRPSLSADKKNTIELCRPCCEELQLLGFAPVAKEGVEPIPDVTIEDKIREIVSLILDERGVG